jgi:hypothetical protein
MPPFPLHAFMEWTVTPYVVPVHVGTGTLHATERTVDLANCMCPLYEEHKLEEPQFDVFLAVHHSINLFQLPT